VFALGVSIAMAFVMPLLLALMRHSPRLAWTGILLLWVSPIPVAAIVHRTTHGVLDFADTKRAASGGKVTIATSLWAGFLAWVTIIFATMITSLVMLVIDPPPVDPDALAILDFVAQVARGGEGIVRALVWIVVAAYVYELERNVHDSD
jgi:hypothetical protein